MFFLLRVIHGYLWVKTGNEKCKHDTFEWAQLLWLIHQTQLFHTFSHCLFSKQQSNIHSIILNICFGRFCCFCWLQVHVWGHVGQLLHHIWRKALSTLFWIRVDGCLRLPRLTVIDRREHVIHVPTMKGSSGFIQTLFIWDHEWHYLIENGPRKEIQAGSGPDVSQRWMWILSLLSAERQPGAPHQYPQNISKLERSCTIRFYYSPA